jgi:hypothetical protein
MCNYEWIRPYYYSKCSHTISRPSQPGQYLWCDLAEQRTPPRVCDGSEEEPTGSLAGGSTTEKEYCPDCRDPANPRKLKKKDDDKDKEDKSSKGRSHHHEDTRRRVVAH